MVLSARFLDFVRFPRREKLHTKQNHLREQRISANTGGKGISKQELDSARSALRIAESSVKERQASLSLMEKGVRSEQREASVAQVRATEAQLTLVQYHLAQAELRSPVDAVVRARLQEPSDMTGPQKAVYTLALSQPKWVRVWLNEGDLGRVKSGMPASVFTDFFLDKPVTSNEGWLYLAVVLNLFSRRVIGRSMGGRMTAELVMDALLMAVWRLKPPAEVLIHSDQGSQYTSERCQHFMASHNLKSSMSRRGNCHDKAVAESFFQLLKRERIKKRVYKNISI